MAVVNFFENIVFIMKRKFFLLFNNQLSNAGNKKGQAFPFLILVLVIVLIAAMAYVNISQVDTHKIDTMNAADTAALAGASTLAQTANNIADINVRYIKEVYKLNFWIGLFLPGYHYIPTARLSTYITYATRVLSAYLDSCLSVYKAVQSSAASAHTSAFGNMDVAEAEKREGSYAGPRAKSNFSEWLDGVKFYDGASEQGRAQDTTNLTYSWWPYQYDFTQEKQTQPDFGNNARAERITTIVKKPDERTLELDPMPPLPQTTVYFGFCGPEEVPPTCDTTGRIAFCSKVTVPTQQEMINNMIEGMIAIRAIFLWTIYADLYDSYAPAGMNDILVNLAASMIIPVVGWIQPWQIQLICPPASEPCGCLYFTTGAAIYLWPVPWIKDLRPHEAGVSVQVTRFSPTKDLGLWQFRHGSITSGARASMYGGNVNSWSSDDGGGYKIRIDEVWDEERVL